jgi:peptidoglycan hydrolase-like protein with peptidoglycan-binding domain
MKRSLLAFAMAAALFLPMVIGQPSPASAGTVGGILCKIVSLGFGCQPFGSTPDPSCPITQVGANATFTTHGYDYVLTAPCGDIHVIGVYDTNTKMATEEFSSSEGKITVIWTCLNDPWIYPAGQMPACDFKQRTITFANNLPIPTYLQSVSPLSDLSRQTLNGQLQNAIKQLPPPNQAPAPVPAPAPAPIVYHAPSIVNGWPQLDLRTQGEAVKSLQYLLLAHGETLPVSGVDGLFGPETERAVRAFQRAQGLTVDGIVGPQTWQALIVYTQLGDQGPAVQAVQSQLASRGVDIVVSDYFGNQIDALVRSYQQKTGLFVDGEVGPQTWQALLAGK